MITYKELKEKLYGGLPILDEVILTNDGNTFELYEDRKWVSGRFDSNIGVDQPTSGAGQKHAHVYGRKDNQLVVVNFDGTASHNTKGKLHKKDADALRARGWNIPPNNLIEWQVVEIQPQLLLG